MSIRDGTRLVKLELQGWIVLNSLQWRHLHLAVDLNDSSCRLVNAKEQVDHALPERILEVVIVVSSHGSD